jgi:hypothetical protein
MRAVVSHQFLAPQVFWSFCVSVSATVSTHRQNISVRVEMSIFAVRIGEAVSVVIALEAWIYDNLPRADQSPVAREHRISPDALIVVRHRITGDVT